MTDLGTRLLTLSIGGEDVTAEISNCRITTGAAESDFTSFTDAAAGGARQYRLQGVAKQNVATSSVWSQIWSASGSTVAVVIKPNGGVSAGPTTPTFTGNVVIQEADGDLLGGEANASTTSKFTVEINWPFTAKPTMAVA